VWTVGEYFDETNGITKTLVEHWNGKAWSVIRSPNTGSNANTLKGVMALSRNNAWAVGYDIDASMVGNRPLIEHWNGSQWSVVPSPIPEGGAFLSGVAAVSPHDIWAVGSSHRAGQALIEHWNGSQWSIVPSPVPSVGFIILHAVTTVSAKNVWAVGTNWQLNNGVLKPVIEHWNGSTWSIVSSPDFSSGEENSLEGIAALTKNDMWAVGYFRTATGIDALIEHWNGSTWTIVPGGDTKSTVSQLYAVTTISRKNVWAVGFYLNTHVPGYLLNQSLIEHWNGERWEVVPSPTVAEVSQSYLYGVTRVQGATPVWAVGTSITSNWQTLIERYS
jgi:hypothetical protein